MIKPEIPSNEKERLEALNRYDILDTLSEEEYDAITKIGSIICNKPISVISLVDPTRQWFKSKYGIDADETPRELAFCAHAINQPDDLFIVEDATKDERFHDNPLVVDAPNVIFYAGAPLNTPDGHTLGTICVIDNKPGKLNEDQKEALRSLSIQVMALLELRRKNKELVYLNDESIRLNGQLNAFAYRLSHDLKAPVRSVSTVVDWIKEEYQDSMEDQLTDWISLIHDKSSYMSAVIEGMLGFSKVSNLALGYESFNLKQLVEEIEKGCSVYNECVFHFEGVDEPVFHSRSSFNIILQNLMTNSLKYNDKEQCDIFISLERKGKDLKLIYEDNGPGISAEYREKVFGLFETLGAKNANSVGIGLATLKSVCERLNGTVELKDRASGEEGVCFEMNFPYLTE